MVAHQTIGQHLGVKPRGGLIQNSQKTLTVHVVLKNRLTPITTRSHAVDRAGEFNAKRAGHGVCWGEGGGKRQDLTPKLRKLCDPEAVRSCAVRLRGMKPKFVWAELVEASACLPFDKLTVWDLTRRPLALSGPVKHAGRLPQR